MTPSARAFLAAGTPGLACLPALVFFLLIGFALPQPAAAQNSAVRFGATWTISDADPVDEGSTAEFEITLSRTISFAFSSPVTYTAESAALTDLGSTRPTTLAITNTDTTYTIEVPIEDDDLVEGEETFTVSVSLGELNEVEVLLTATGTINASDGGTPPPAVAPAITTQPTDQSVTVGGSATFTVTATGTPTPTYQWSFDGTEISGATSASYAISSAALTDAGDYTVVVTNTAGTVTSTAATLTVTAAAVAPQITTQPTDQSVTVGDDATFTVAATGTPTPTYQWSFDGTEISGATSASYTVSGAAEADAGDYTVVVTNTAGTVTSTAATLTVTAAAAPSVDISIANGLASEGNDISFPVTLGAQLLEARTLNVTYAGVTADLDADLESSPPTTLTLPTGTTTVNLVVPTFEDRLAEPNETFTVTLSLPTPPTNPRNTLTITTATATGTIGDDDSANITIDDQTKAENEDFRIGITTTSARNSEPVDITWTVTSGTTNGGSVDDDLDLTASTGSITLPASVGENRAEVFLDIPIDDDDINENDETFTLALTANGTAPRGVFFGTSASAVLTITDNDDPTAAPDLTVDSVSVSSASVVEGISFTISATVNNGGNAASAATTLTYYRSADATITTGDTSIGADVVDALAANGSSPETEAVSIATAGTYYVGACVPMVSDETNTTNNCSTGVQVTVTAAPPTAAPDLTVDSVSVSSASVVEGATFTINATVNNGGDGASALTTLTWYRSADATITTGDTSIATDTVQILAANGRSLESAQVSIATAGTYYVGGCVPAVSGESNTDNNCSTGVQVTVTAVVDATVSIAAASALENVSGGNAEFTVSLTTAVAEDVVLAVAYAVGDTNPVVLATDLGTRPNTVTIDQGQTSATLLVPIIDDSIVESDETFTVTISEGTTSLPTGVTIGTNSTATGTITNDDTAVLGFTGSTSFVPNEGLTFTTTVSFLSSGGATSAAVPVTLTWAAVPSTSTRRDPGEPEDLDPSSGTVTIPAGQSSADITITAVDDTEDEPFSEELFIQLGLSATSPLPPDVSLVASSNPAYQRLVRVGDNDAPPDITVSIGDISVAENVSGGNAEFTITLSETLLDPITFGLTYAPGDTNPVVLADDLGDVREVFAFRGGNLTGTFTVPIVNDELVEGDETFTITIVHNSGGGGGNVTFTKDKATGTIVDDDDPPPPAATVSIGNASVAENDGNAEFTVSLTQAVESDVTVAVAYTDGTATLATDLGTRPTTVTIDEGNTEATLEVPVTNDNIVEGNEDFTVTISEGSTALPEGVTIGTAATGTGTITDNDLAEITLGPSTLEVAENGTFTYTVSLSKAADEAVTVRWTATDGTASVDDDLQEQTNTVTFDANDNTAQEFTISPVDDPDDEVNETFTVTLEVDTAGGNPLPTGVTIGTSNSSTATITDNDDPTGPDLTVDGVTVSSASVVEGAAFTINATVNNEGNAASAATTLTYYRSTDATITTGDTSIATDPISTLAASGSSTQNTSVSIATADTYYVGACVPTVSGETNANNNCSTGVQVVITAATVAPAITTQPTNQSVTVGGSATFTVAATGTPPPTYQWRFEGSDIAGATSATYTLSNAALTNAGDYTVVVTNTAGTVTSSAATLTVTAAAVAPQITTQPTDQSVTVGGSATFTVTATGTPTPTYQWRFEGSDIAGATSASYTLSNAALTNAGDYTVVVTNTAGTVTSNAATLTVTTAATPDARVSIANASVAENASAGSIGFTVSLDRAVDNAVTLAVAYTAGTATLATDLGTRPTTVTINQGQTEATLAVPVTNDAIVERNETFTVTLSEGTTALPDDVTIGTGVATGTITDADTATVALSSTAPPPASEGGTITFTVELDNPVAEGFSLGWAASNGTATVDDDLDDQSGTVAIDANARTATFTIPITNDDDLESSETFTVALTGAPTGLVNIAPSRVTVDRTSATGTINASDTGDGNTVNIGNRTVAENVAGGSIDFTVSLDRAVGSAVTLAVAYTAGTATLADDLRTPRPTTVTINANTTSATLLVPIANETLVEGSETFTVTLSAGTTPLPAGVIIGNGTATGTITNDDEAEIRTNVSEVNEAAASLRFRPGVTAPLAQDLALSWSVTGGTASAADFSQYVSSGTVTIPARQNSGSILFFPRDDDVVEGSETLTLTFAPAPGTTLPDGVTFRSTTATGTIRDNDEVDINLRVVADVSETDARLTFRSELTARLTQDITLAWEVTGGTASAEDFSEYVGSGTVTVETGRGGAPIRFFPIDDDAVEGPETLEVTISVVSGTSLPRGVNLGTTTATATIVDSGEVPTMVDLNIDDASAAEGTNIRFPITLSAALTEEQTLNVTYTAGSASLDDLGSDRPTTLTLPTGTTTVTLEVPTVDDDSVEESEAFTVTLSSVPGDEAEGAPLANTLFLSDPVATGTITDDDEAPAPTVDLSIDDASAAEGANIRFPITLSAALTEEQTLNVTYTAGSASLDDLGSDRPTTLTLPTGTTTVTLEVPTVDDDSVEESEAFSVTLSSVPGDEAEGAPLANTLFLSDPVATGTITDNDEAPAPTVDLSIDDASAAEGDNILFPITLSAALTEEQTLNVTYTAGSASLDDLGSDRPTTLTLPTGTTTVTLEVPTVDDDSVEESEAFSVTLSSVPGDEAEGAPLANTLFLSDPVATGTITDNDEAPAPTVDLSIDDASAAEGDNILFPITLSAALTEEQTLNVTYTAGSASLDDLGSDRPTTLTLPTGTTTVNLEVPTVDDDSVEESEAFTVTLSSVPGDEAEGAPLANTLFLSDPVATGTITDNDEVPAPTVDLSIDDASAAEGDNILFPITLSAALTEEQTLNVNYTAGSASLDDLGSDRPTTLTLPTGTTTLNLAVPTVDDDSVEESEAFTVTLSSVPGDEAEGAPLANTLFLSDPVATGTITDDDEAPPPEDDATVSLSPLTLSRTEGEPFTFQVALSRASASPVTVRWRATSGTARVSGDDSDLGPGQDVTGTVVFAAGTDETQTFSIATLDDLLVEGTETFTVKLNGRLPVGVSYGTRRATATLVDDDRATVSIAPPTPSEDEGGVFNFAVNLSAPVHEAVTVTWRAVSGTARVSGDDSDLEANEDVTGTVVFAAGTDEDQTFSIATLDDLLVEGDETFTVKLSGRLPMRVNYGTRTATATIADDDRATVVLAPPTPSEDEGGVFNFTASLSQAVAEEVSVIWTATSGTARVSGDDSDLEAGQDVTGTVVFAAGTAEDQTFSLATLNDTRVEGDEDFTVTLNGDLPSGVDYGTRTAIATIVDDDLATVDIEDAPPVAEDAGPARFRVTLNRELDQDAVLDVAYVAGSAALADLGSPRPATVTIAAGGTEASLDVPIFDDELVEGEETFTVILTGDSLPNGVSVADGVALGTIARTSEQSALIESRRSGAGAALRRHVNRFDRMTSTLVRNRLDGSKTQNLSGSKNLGDDNPLSVGGGLSRGLGGTHWGTWIDGAWAGLGGTASGQQADLYGGVDYRSGNGRWLIGALTGYELADLDAGEANYQADFTQIGFYGGARLSERLLFDGAATYGTASPEIALGDVSASYDARRFTARAALTGNFGLEFGLENGSVRVEPQLGALYARETLGAFTDSVGGVAGREVLELGRFNAGPRLTWEFEGGQMVGGIRLQSDVLKLQDGVQGRFSGAADIGLRLELRPGFRMGFQLDLDGIGNEDDFGSLGGRIELGIGFGSGPRTTQVQTRNERGGPTRESSRPAVSKPNFTHH